MERKIAQAGGILTEAQVRLLRRWQGRQVDPEQHIEAPHPGHLLCQDTYFVGTIKGVGRIYMQSVVDAHCSLGFAKLYLSKVPMTAVDVLNDRVLPFYEKHSVDPERLLTDHGTEFCSIPSSSIWPSASWSTAVSSRAHRRATASVSASTGLSRRNSLPSPSGKTLYESVAQLQADLDQYLAFYNRERPHQGYRTRGGRLTRRSWMASNRCAERR